MERPPLNHRRVRGPRGKGAGMAGSGQKIRAWSTCTSKSDNLTIWPRAQGVKIWLNFSSGIVTLNDISMYKGGGSALTCVVACLCFCTLVQRSVHCAVQYLQFHIQLGWVAPNHFYVIYKIWSSLHANVNRLLFSKTGCGMEQLDCTMHCYTGPSENPKSLPAAAMVAHC